MSHRVPVSKSLGNGEYGLPLSTKIRESNLPAYLHQANLITQEDLDEIDGVSITTINNLIAASRADVLAQVNEMLRNAKNAAFVYQQPHDAAAVSVNHGLGRRAVAVQVFSLDYETQYEFFQVYPLDDNNVQLAFDEPMTFVALVS